MEIDTERVDAAVLALLLLGLHDGCRAWKGSIGTRWSGCTRRASSPIPRKAKSVILTEEGQREAERLFARCSPSADDPVARDAKSATLKLP